MYVHLSVQLINIAKQNEFQLRIEIATGGIVDLAEGIIDNTHVLFFLFLEACMDLWVKDYKFYLGFENSQCNEYVTEKFFERITQDLVVVTFENRKMKNIAPKKTYINANSFASPKDLANYLLYLDKNEEEYLSYFWWKEYYNVKPRSVMMREAFCRLCEMLNDESLPPKRYADIYDWWYTKSECYKGYRNPSKN